jgi:hypothetical protein
MENLSYLPKPKRSDRKVTLWKSGDFTVGIKQPPKKDKLYNPLQGISSHKTFYGATKVSYRNQDFDKDTDPATLEKIAITYQQAGDEHMANRFADAYASKVLSGEYVVNCDRSLYRLDDDLDSYLVKPIELTHDDFGDRSDPSMGLSDVVISHKSPCTKEKYTKISDLTAKTSKKRRGSGGITPIAKRKTRSAVQIMQEKYSLYCLAFGTFTLPALRPEELERVNTNFSDLTRQLFQELKRLAERRGLDTDYVFVVEIQEKRYRAWGQFCPHIHCVMQSRKDRFADPAIHYSEIREIWERLLGNLLGRKVDCPAATQWEKMKRRKVGEMGKYMTKGSQIAKEAIAKGDGHMLPTAWSGMSDNLKKEVKASIKILTGQEAEDFIDNLEVLKDAGLLSYVPIMWSPPDIDRQITIGFAGWVKNIDQVFKFLAGCYEHFASHTGVIYPFKVA